jgi:uroporphyrinogen decarboxylase
MHHFWRIQIHGAPSAGKQAARTLDDFGPHPGHVFNLGHGITPNVDPEHVAVLVDAVHAQAG